MANLNKLTEKQVQTLKSNTGKPIRCSDDRGLYGDLVMKKRYMEEQIIKAIKQQSKSKSCRLAFATK